MQENNFDIFVNLLSSDKERILDLFKSSNPKLAHHIILLEITLKENIIRKNKDNPEEMYSQINVLNIPVFTRVYFILYSLRMNLLPQWNLNTFLTLNFAIQYFFSPCTVFYFIINDYHYLFNILIKQYPYYFILN